MITTKLVYAAVCERAMGGDLKQIVPFVEQGGKEILFTRQLALGVCFQGEGLEDGEWENFKLGFQLKIQVLVAGRLLSDFLYCPPPESLPYPGKGVSFTIPIIMGKYPQAGMIEVRVFISETLLVDLVLPFIPDKDEEEIENSKSRPSKYPLRKKLRDPDEDEDEEEENDY